MVLSQNIIISLLYVKSNERFEIFCLKQGVMVTSSQGLGIRSQELGVRSGGRRARHIALMGIQKCFAESVFICSPKFVSSWQLAVNSICIPPDKRLLSNRFHFFTNRMNPPKARLLKVINGYGISDSFITFYTPF